MGTATTSTRALTIGPISRRHARGALAALGALGAIAAASPAALAQGAPPPAQPPPTYQAQPPPGYYGQPQPAPYYGQPPSTTGYYAPPGSYGTVGVGPKYLDWEEGDPIQPGYHPTTRIRRGLVIGGAVTFGTTYLLSAFSAAILVEGSNTTNNNGSMYGPLFAPVIGPFITIGTAHASGGGTFVLVLDGLSQTGGLAMLIAGLVAPKTALVRNDMAKTTITPVPMSFGPSSAGLGAVGTF